MGRAQPTAAPSPDLHDDRVIALGKHARHLLTGVWDDIDPGGGTRVGTQEELEEALYLRQVMEE